MLKILHFADVHFEKEKLDKCNRSAEFIIQKAGELKPDLIVSAGDIFNRKQALDDKSAIAAAKRFVMALADEAPLVMCKGNEIHDASGCLEVFMNLDTKHPMLVTEGAGSYVWCKGDNLFYSIQPGYQMVPFDATVILHLFSYPEKGQFLRDKPNLSIDESNELLQSAIKQIFMGFGAISIDAKCPVIVVGHGFIDGSRKSSGQQILGQDIMLSKHDLALAGADVQCWGHIHEEQFFEVPGSNGVIWYSGSTYHKDWGETTPRRFLLHEVERGKCTTTSITIPSRGLSLHETHWTPTDGFCELCEPAGQDVAVDWIDAELRVRVHVTKEASGLLTDAMIEAQYPGFHSIKIERVPVVEDRVRASNIVKAKTLREKVLEWSRATGKELQPEVLEYADETERGYAS